MNEIHVGSVVRVIDFTSQSWGVFELEWSTAEKNMVSCYAGKVGKVIRIDKDKSPYIVDFAEGARVPMRFMRFYKDEVEEVG